MTDDFPMSDAHQLCIFTATMASYEISDIKKMPHDVLRKMSDPHEIYD